MTHNHNHNHDKAPSYQVLETNVRKQMAKLQQADGIEDVKGNAKASFKGAKSQVGGLMMKEKNVKGNTRTKSPSPSPSPSSPPSPPPSKSVFQRYKIFATALMLLVVFTLYAAQRYIPYESDYINAYFQANPNQRLVIIGEEKFNELLISLRQTALKAFPQKMKDDFRAYVFSFMSKSLTEVVDKQKQPLTGLEKFNHNSKQLMESFVGFISVSQKMGVTSAKEMVNLSKSLSSYVIKPTLRVPRVIASYLPFTRHVTTNNIKHVGNLIVDKIEEGVINAPKMVVNRTWETLSIFKTSLSGIMAALVEPPKQRKKNDDED